MAQKLYAAFRLLADADTWFSSLSEEQQKQYIELHPGSKYAKQAGKGKPDSKGTPNKPAEPGSPASKSKPSALTTSPEQLKETHDFAVSKEAEPKSPLRTRFGKMIIKHSKALVHHLKEEVKEAAVAGHSVTKLLRGKKLSGHEKQALKATSIRLAIICGSMAIGGGLMTAAGHGVKHLAEEIAHDFMAHGLIGVAEKTLHASSEIIGDAEESDSDAGLEELTKRFADYMATSPNVQAILAKAGEGSTEETE